MFKSFSRTSSRSFSFLLFAISTLLTSVTPAMAQDTGLSGRLVGTNVSDQDQVLTSGFTISGTVIAQAGGESLPDVQVDFHGINYGYAGSVATDVNGDYSFVVPEEDDYFLLLPKYGIPSPYLPEVWPGIYCDFQVCSIFETGSPVSVSGADVNGIDFALDAGFVMTGTVLDAADSSPIEGVEVCVHRTDASWTGSCGTSDVNGDYQTVGLPAGSNYVSYANPDSAGYGQQMYDGLDCPLDNCDFSSGTIIELGNPGDASDIDFDLSSVYSPSNNCRSGDLIATNGFEALPEYTINFTSDTNVVITEAGQQAQFSVEFLDENGVPLDTSSLEWCLEDETNLNVASAGTNATVDSTGFALGSVDLVVRDPRTSIHAIASILFADLQPDATYVDSESVIDNGGGGDTVILSRNALTELLQPGDVLVSGDRAGLLVRVLSVTLTPDRVILEVEPATITEAFENLDITRSSLPQSVSVQYDAGSRQAIMRTYDSTNQVIAENVFLDSLECNAEDQSDFGLTLTGGDIDWDLDIKLEVTMKIVSSQLTEFSVIDNGSVKLEANTGRLSFASQLSGVVKCELELPKLESVRVPISAFSFELGLQPLLGVEVSGTIEGSSFYIAGPQGAYYGAIENGIKYTPTGGWTKVKGSSWDGTASLFSGEFLPDLSFGLNMSAYGGVDIDFTANLGWGFEFTTYTLATVKFASFSAEALLNANFSSPFDYRHKDYTGPNWEIKSVISGNYKAELTGGKLKSLLDRLDLPVSVDISGTIFDPIEIELFHSPRVIKLTQTCSPRSCYLDPSLDEEDHASFIVQTDEDRSGTVFVLAEAPGQDELIDLTSSALTHSSSLGEWIPDQDEDEGTYHAYIRLKTDLLSNAFPYRVNTEGLEDIEITPTLSLDVEIIDADSNNPIEGEPPPDLVTSDLNGIECGEVCSSRFPMGSEVTLTANELGNWLFEKWDSGGACAGSELRQCTINLDSDQSAKALYKKDIYSFVFGYTIDSGTTFVEMPELYTADGSIKLLNSLGYTIALKKEGEIVSPFYQCYPPLGKYDEEYNLGCTARFGVPVQSEDEYLGPVSYSLTDDETGNLITRELNVTISNEAYRSIVGKTFTRTVTGGTFCQHFEEEAVFNSDFTWTSNLPLGGGDWSYLNDVSPHSEFVCQDDDGNSSVCRSNLHLAVINTGNIYICETPQYLRVNQDGTAYGGSFEGVDWKEYSY